MTSWLKLAAAIAVWRHHCDAGFDCFSAPERAMVVVARKPLSRNHRYHLARHAGHFAGITMASWRRPSYTSASAIRQIGKYRPPARGFIIGALNDMIILAWHAAKMQAVGKQIRDISAAL